MPDQVTTSSLMTLTAHAPGGLQVGTTQDSNSFTLLQLIQLFGTNNVAAVKQNVTQTVNNVETNNNVNLLRTDLVTSSSLIQGRNIFTRIPRITRLAEEQYSRGEVLPLYTGSRTSQEQAIITGSLQVVLDPRRGVAGDDDMRRLYEDTGSIASGSSLERIIAPDELKAHEEVYETKLKEFFTPTASVYTIYSGSYLAADDALTNPSGYDYDASGEIDVYISDGILYSDERRQNVFRGTSKYHKLKNQDETWGILPTGKVYHRWLNGEKNKPRWVLTLMPSTVTDKPEDSCIDGDNPTYKNVHYHDHLVYTDEYLTMVYPGQTGSYVKNFTWDVVHEIDGNGSIIDTIEC